jgi:YHS domain-containing protein
MGGAVAADSPKYAFNGVVYGVCCAGCEGRIIQSLDKKHDGLIGYSLFDPVSRVAVKAQKSAGYVDYKSVRYYFDTAESKAAFLKESAKYAKPPTLEVPGKCIVQGETISADIAAAYRDTSLRVGDKTETVRVYFCCPACVKSYDANPAKYLTPAKPTKPALAKL